MYFYPPTSNTCTPGWILSIHVQKLSTVGPALWMPYLLLSIPLISTTAPNYQYSSISSAFNFLVTPSCTISSPRYHLFCFFWHILTITYHNYFVAMSKRQHSSLLSVLAYKYILQRKGVKKEFTFWRINY